MDSTKRDNKEVQEKLMALQKEKDQVRKESEKEVDGMATWRFFPPFFRAVLRAVCQHGH